MLHIRCDVHLSLCSLTSLNIEVFKMIDRIDDQPTPDETFLRRKGIYHDRRRGKDRRSGYAVIDPSKDRRKGERRRQIIRNYE